MVVGRLHGVGLCGVSGWFFVVVGGVLGCMVWGRGGAVVAFWVRGAGCWCVRCGAGLRVVGVDLSVAAWFWGGGFRGRLGRGGFMFFVLGVLVREGCLGGFRVLRVGLIGGFAAFGRVRVVCGWGGGSLVGVAGCAVLVFFVDWCLRRLGWCFSFGSCGFRWLLVGFGVFGGRGLCWVRLCVGGGAELVVC